jgi:hypothetical protein
MNEEKQNDKKTNSEAAAENRKKASDRQKAAARERDLALLRERRELLKQKAGVVTEQEAAAGASEPAAKPHYTLPQKIESFFYLYKTQIILASSAAFIIVFLMVNLFTRVTPDVTIGVVSRDGNLSYYTENIAKLLEPFCPDFYPDGKITVQVTYFGGPVVNDENPTLDQTAEAIKLQNSFRSDNNIMYIMTDDEIADMEIESGILADGRVIFQSDPNGVLYGYALKGTDFAEKIGYPDFGDNYYVVFRKPIENIGDIETFKQNYDNAVTLWKNYLSGEVQ